MRTALGLVSVMCVLLAAWFLSIGLHGLGDELQWLVFATIESGCLVLFGLTAYAVWKTRAGPVSLIIDEGGILFRWNSGRKKLLRWGSFGRGTYLLDYSTNQAVSGLLPKFRWEIRRRNMPPSSVTKEAFDAIIDSARRMGMRVETTDLPNPWRGWAPCRAIHILPPTTGAAAAA
ncbi:MAG TPA: hypothetical protein VJS68_00470 [Thermoplasmata archaeon]|nr:hypothetical protein [Thermoplasmata archaeon]